MVKMNLYEVKTHLSKVARMVREGETVVLCERNKPFAEIHALPGIGKIKKRQLGLMKGLCPVTGDFFKADAEIASLFNESPAFSSSKASKSR